VAATRESLAHTISIVGKESANIVAGSIGNTTYTFYPDAEAESTSVDGHIEKGDASWNTVFTASAGAAQDSEAVIHPRVRHNGSDYNITRAFMLFDTSSLGSDEIDVATLSLHDNPTEAGPLYQDNDSQAYLNVYAATPASNTALVDDDFDQVGSTTFATAIRLDVLNDNDYSTFTLNSTGIAAIDQNGVTKLSVREGHDVENTAIANSSTNQLNASAADKAGTTEDPMLVVQTGVVYSPYEGHYAPLVENGNFRKYEYLGDATDEWWKVTDKFGTVYTFGNASTARQHKEGEATTTFKWMLEEVRDLNDNFISYEYSKDDGQIYPSKVTYTGSGSTDGIFEVAFHLT
jgi:hypothetical protein